MNKSRKSSRLARKGFARYHTQHEPKEEEECIQLGQNGKPVDEIDIIMEKTKSKFPICPSLNKRVNQHNIADLPSFADEQETVSSQSNSEVTEITRKARAKGNSLIEAKNRFRSLLQQQHLKNNPDFQTQMELDKKASQVVEAPRTRSQAQSSNSKANEPPVKKQLYFKIGGGKKVNFTPLLQKPTDDREDDECSANLHRAVGQYAYSRYSLIPELRPKKRADPPPIDNDPDGPYTSEPLDIYHLPNPVPLPLDEKGKPENLLIPKKIRTFVRPQLDIISAIGSREQEPIDVLREDLKKYFQDSANDFKRAYNEDSYRYRHCFSILNSMFEMNRKRLNGETVFEATPYDEDSDIDEDYNQELSNISQLEDKSVAQAAEISSQDSCMSTDTPPEVGKPSIFAPERASGSEQQKPVKTIVVSSQDTSNDAADDAMDVLSDSDSVNMSGD